MTLRFLSDHKLHVLRAELPSSPRGYDLVIQRGLLSDVDAILAQLDRLPRRPRQVFILSQEVVSSRYSLALMAAFEQRGIPAVMHHVPQGEGAKSLDIAQGCYHAAMASGLTRSGLVIALGGGIVGDLAGFVAATFSRGVPFLQIPTTLLAQIDSSVGGKVAVNLPYGDKSNTLVKNAVGVFYQPQAVWIDPDTLKTLPQREQLAGLAELVKYALIEQTASGQALPVDQTLWHHLEKVRNTWPDHLESLIARCCEIKLAVVQRDETEQMGLNPAGRACLNLGHTFGHALESVTHHTLMHGEAVAHQVLLHGEAVALGMRLASRLSHRLGLISLASLERIEALFDALTLPNAFPEACDPEKILSAMRHDKKNASANEITLILPLEPLGTLTIRTDVSTDAVLAVLATLK